MTRAGELCRTLHHRQGEGRVQDKEGVHPNQQQFSFAEKQLEDDSPVKPHKRGESMLWLASSYLEHEATSQEGVKKYHLRLSIPEDMSKNPINGVDTIVRDGRGFNIILDAHSFELVHQKTSLSTDDFYNHPEKNHRCLLR